MVYLPGSKLSQQGNNLSLVSSAKREIILAAGSESDVKSWEAALQYSLKRAEVFEVGHSQRSAPHVTFFSLTAPYRIYRLSHLLKEACSSGEARDINSRTGKSDILFSREIRYCIMISHRQSPRKSRD